jgi:threonine dehydrogenase-like Zn-dependent dehydrogenase
MRAAIMYGAGDVRVENVPDPSIVEPTDAIMRVVRACICGSDLWPYNDMPKRYRAMNKRESIKVLVTP